MAVKLALSETVNLMEDKIPTRRMWLASLPLIPTLLGIFDSFDHVLQAVRKWLTVDEDRSTTVCDRNTLSVSRD